MNKEYFVRNLYATGYLLSEGFICIRTEKSPRGQTLFFFSDDDEGLLKQALNKFYENLTLKKFIKGVIDAKTLMKTN